jgi:hypothetical protein
VLQDMHQFAGTNTAHKCMSSDKVDVTRIA